MKVAVAWSGGKDCAWALRDVGPRATHLVTTFDESTGLVPTHNVALMQIEQQARVLERTLVKVPLPQPCPNAAYVERFTQACAGFDAIVFGDLFLGDIRSFREQSFPGFCLEFPLWGRDTNQLARQMIAEGLRARITAASNPAWIGRPFDRHFLDKLPRDVDPCGENGEFHTLVEPECLASFR